jgi:hypothetical protein
VTGYGFWQLAQAHAARSSNPVAFMGRFTAALNAIGNGQDLAGARRDLTDPLTVAAEITALAALRTRATRRHQRDTCRCDACRIHRTQELHTTA